MTTAERLEAITEPGKFELLVTSILRKDNRDYAAIIHTGINAQGKTIKSPVDGFCQVPGSIPPRFLLVEHTITDRDGLEKKWLYDHSSAKNAKVSESKDGDLLKAGREAQKLRNDFPDAKFTVILTTNQHLPQGIELINKVYKKAAELGVDVDIWEQSRLADFLDSNCEGQWLRKKYLDIKAEMLSESLLRSLCEQSLANYEKQFLTHPNIWIFREIDSKIEKGAQSNAYTIQLLIGESGSGKSAAAYNYLKKHLASGGYGLWVSNDFFRECTTFENVVDKILRNLYPSLLLDAGRAALQILPARSRLLLIVDDVNRADNPTILVQKLVNWSKPQQSSTPNSQLIFSPYLVICPTWSKNISPDFKEMPWVDQVFIGSMNPAEAMTAVQKITSFASVEITNTEASSLATKLGNDPILIALFGSLLSNPQPTQSLELANLTENVIERFIKTSINESSSSGKFLENEYRAALSTLATHMLKNRKLYPLWTEIKNWLRESPDDLDALRELLRHNKLCRLTQEDRFVFRHDRIQETLLVKSMINFLAETSLKSDIIREPFYAEIIGKAIAISPQKSDFLRELRYHLPLVLVEAIKHFTTPINNYHQAIIKEVKEWSDTGVANGSVPKSVIDAVCWSLVETDSPVVLDITETFSTYPLVLLARLRNGCVESGIRYCILVDFFYNNSLRDEVLEQVKRYQKEKLLTKLGQVLKSCDITDEWRNGALLLSGFLGFSELEEDVVKCWELATNKTLVLHGTTWAAIQICRLESTNLLNLIVKHWDELSEKHDSDSFSSVDWNLEPLALILAHCSRVDIVKYIITLCNTYSKLSNSIVFICHYLEQEDVVELLFKSAADIYNKGEANAENLPPWRSILSQICAQLNNEYLFDRRKLSSTFMSRLKVWWEGTQNNDFVKREAFYLWCASTDNNQINILKTILSDSPFFYSAVERRAKLGDKSVVKELLLLLPTNFHLFSVAHNVFCEDIMLVAQIFLEALQNTIPTDFSGGCEAEHYILSKFITQIPVKDAEILLEKYWNYLGYSSIFILTALYVGTPKCINLATSRINKCPSSIPIFHYVNYIFGFLDSEKQKCLNVQKLDNLLPYLNHINKITIEHIATACKQMQIPEWGHKNLSNYISEQERKLYYPSDDDLLEELNEIALHQNSEWRVISWLKQFDDIRYTPDQHHLLSVVDCWLAFNSTVKGLKIAAAYIQAIGTRKDLSILDQYTIEGSPDEIAKIKESARFAVYRRSLI